LSTIFASVLNRGNVPYLFPSFSLPTPQPERAAAKRVEVPEIAAAWLVLVLFLVLFHNRSFIKCCSRWRGWWRFFYFIYILYLLFLFFYINNKTVVTATSFIINDFVIKFKIIKGKKRKSKRGGKCGQDLAKLAAVAVLVSFCFFFIVLLFIVFFIYYYFVIVFKL
jgi:hypothetical protein